MSAKKVFVTGGTGFIGANLVEVLNERGYAVTVLHRPTSKLLALEGLAYNSAIGDILSQPDRLAKLIEGADLFFHVAAVSDYWRQGTDWLYKINVEGTRNVLEAAKLAGVRRFVYTSSLSAMGLPPDDTPLDESDTFNQNPKQFPYAHSKHLAETEVYRAAEEGLSTIIVNPSVVLGPRDLNEISGSLITEAAKGRLRFKLPGGSNFVAVEDVVAGHIAAACKGRVGERYILGGTNLSYEEASTFICKSLGVPPPSIPVPPPILPVAARLVSIARHVLGNRIPLDANQVLLSGLKIYANSQKAIDELDLPQTSFETAVNKAVAWYRAKGYL